MGRSEHSFKYWVLTDDLLNDSWLLLYAELPNTIALIGAAVIVFSVIMPFVIKLNKGQ